MYLCTSVKLFLFGNDLNKKWWKQINRVYLRCSQSLLLQCLSVFRQPIRLLSDGVAVFCVLHASHRMHEANQLPFNFLVARVVDDVFHQAKRIHAHFEQIIFLALIIMLRRLHCGMHKLEFDSVWECNELAYLFGMGISFDSKCLFATCSAESQVGFFLEIVFEVRIY